MAGVPVHPPPKEKKKERKNKRKKEEQEKEIKRERKKYKGMRESNGKVLNSVLKLVLAFSHLIKNF